MTPYENRMMPILDESIRFNSTGIGVQDYHELVKRKIFLYKSSHPQIVYDLYHYGMKEVISQYGKYMSETSMNQCDEFLKWILNYANNLEPLRSELLDSSENYWQNELKKGLPDIVKRTMSLMSGDFGVKDLLSLFTGSTYRKEHGIFSKELEYSGKIRLLKSDGWYRFNITVTQYLEKDFYR